MQFHFKNFKNDEAEGLGISRRQKTGKTKRSFSSFLEPNERKKPLDLPSPPWPHCSVSLSLRARTANQATHGKVTHQAAPGYKLGYSIFSCRRQGASYTPLQLRIG